MTFLLKVFLIAPGRVPLHALYVADYGRFDPLVVGPGDKLVAHLVQNVPLLVVRLAAYASNGTGVFLPLPAAFFAPAALLVYFLEFLVAQPFDTAQFPGCDNQRLTRVGYSGNPMNFAHIDGGDASIEVFPGLGTIIVAYRQCQLAVPDKFNLFDFSWRDAVDVNNDRFLPFTVVDAHG